MIFQVFFAALTIGCLFYFLVATRSTALQRIFIVLFFGVGLVFILQPEITNRIAQSLGIGRGADLILYLSTLFLFFICFNFYFRFRAYEQTLTVIVQKLALQHPIQTWDQPKSPITHNPTVSEPKRDA